MKKVLVIVAAFVVCVLAAPSNASAGFGLGGSLGGGFYVSDGSANRTSINLTLDPFYQYKILYLDLGLTFDFEAVPPPPNPQITICPGARVDFKWLYFRAAVPIEVNHPIDYGLLLGVGHMWHIGKHAGAFVEADVQFSNNLGWSTVPIQFRGGMQYAF